MTTLESHFAEGLVQAVSTDKGVLVVTSDDGIDTLVFRKDSNIWKGKDGMSL